MTSQIVITYNSLPLSTDVLEVSDSLNLQVIEIDYSTTYGGLPILQATIDDTIFYTYQYLQNTYNNTNLYTITFDGGADTITIVANNIDSDFTEDSNNSSGRITTLISNVVAPVLFTIDDINTSEADANPCIEVKLTIDTNVQATDITSPVTDTVITNPYIVDVQRTGSFDVTMNNADNANTQTVYIPSLVSADFNADIVLASNGGTVTVTNNYTATPLFTLEYSLDDITYYLSNSFSALPVGSYDVYVRDGLGCSFSLPFEITEFTPPVIERENFYFVSNAQSFRFKVCEDLTTNIKTVFNTLSYEENVESPELNYKQPFEIGDGTVTSQFKSSLETNTATLIDSSCVETPLTVIQKSTNLNIEDVRDGRVLSTTYLNQEYVSVQFGSGNTYDPNTLLENGTYALGNSLPDWIDIGEYLNIQNAGWIKVIDIVPIDGVSTAIMNGLSSSYIETIPQQGLSRRITSIYNSLPYEVYEFDLDLSSLIGSYQIRIDITDTTFDDVSFLSEIIDVQERHLKTHYVEWYNTVNNEINYSYGIRNKARFGYIYNIVWSPNSQQEVFLADTNTVQTDSTVREFYTVQLQPIPTAMSQKFILLTANNRVFIDNLNFLKENESEILHPSSTNLYQITQQLIRANYVFDNIASDGDIDINSGVPLAIEGLGNGLLYIE